MNRFDRLAIKSDGKTKESGWVRAFAVFRAENYTELAKELKVDKSTISRWAATEYMRMYIRGGCNAATRDKQRLTREARRVRRALSPAHYSALTTLLRQYEFSPYVALGYLVDAAEAGMSVRSFAKEMRLRLNGDPGDLWYDYRKYSAGLREMADKVILCPQEFRDEARVLADQMKDLSKQVKGKIE
jgi:hypothetical protein